jgi:hypothetical protein
MPVNSKLGLWFLRAAVGGIVLIGLFGLLVGITGTAKADEIWHCTFTQSRLHVRGHDIVLHGGDAFFLQIKHSVVNIVVGSLPAHATFIPISYTVVENTRARLVGIAHFDLEGGGTSTGRITLDKGKRIVTQSGETTTSDYRKINTGGCTPAPANSLPKPSSYPPSVDEGRPQSSPKLEAPLTERPLVRKRST